MTAKLREFVRTRSVLSLITAVLWTVAASLSAESAWRALEADGRLSFPRTLALLGQAALAVAWWRRWAQGR